MKKMSLLTVLVAAVALTAYSVSGTYAKYTSTFTGSDSARVAKWAFTDADKNAVTTENFEFNLFETVESLNGQAADDATEKTIIAPGTNGSFSTGIMNASEVNAKAKITYSVSNDANIPVEFSKDGITWTSDITTLNDADYVTMNIGSTSTASIQWRWAYERGADDTAKGEADVADTTLGMKGTDTITVTASIEVIQAD